MLHEQTSAYFDHMLVLSERHPRAILAEFVRFSNAQRPPRTLRLSTPVPATRPSARPIRSRGVRSGLQHTDEPGA